MVQNGFSWEMFWQAASAIATTAAVIVALWQTRYQNKKKLKIGFTEDMTYIPIGRCGTVKKNQYFEINVVNVGNRKVYIEHFGVLGKDEDGLRERIIQPSEPFGRPIIFPYELDIEQGLSCPLEKSVFLANLKKEICWMKAKSWFFMQKIRLVNFILVKVQKRYSSISMSIRSQM